MNSPAKVILGVILALFAAYIALSIVTHIVATLIAFALHIAVPVIIVAAIGYGLYRVLAPKALGGGRRLLP